MKSIVLHIVFLFSFGQMIGQTSASFRKTDWTVPEVVSWAEAQKKYPTWNGILLYQGSDSLNHHFISRVMDEWVWFNVKKADLKILDERVYSKTSSEPLGFYYVDATNNFVKTKDY